MPYDLQCRLCAHEILTFFLVRAYMNRSKCFRSQNWTSRPIQSLRSVVFKNSLARFYNSISISKTSLLWCNKLRHYIYAALNEYFFDEVHSDCWRQSHPIRRQQIRKAATQIRRLSTKFNRWLIFSIPVMDTLSKNNC